MQGVDLWLNNPRRGEEACGTSGMKAAINGVLNLSILDGWFDEAYEHAGGWAIGDREPYSEDQDALHASAIYYLLENEIVPMFYERKEQTPREWMRRVKQSLTYISPQFDCRRMVREYMSELYDPAHLQHVRVARRAVTGSAREGALDRARSRGVGPREVRRSRRPRARPGRGHQRQAGSRCAPPSIWPASSPEDVRVEVVMGRIDSNGHLEDTEVMVLPPIEQQGAVAVFGKDIVPERTGRLGYALRVSPNHFEDPLTRPCTSLLKWSVPVNRPSGAPILAAEPPAGARSRPCIPGFAHKSDLGFVRCDFSSCNPGEIVVEMYLSIDRVVPVCASTPRRFPNPLR